ncbi:MULTISPECIES: hypothetical protein [unclassified Streptomyces]|uniref:hypothetical protein n=1 Tax=unclassified Streptomyces TaxID=2593676 RepID=UPI0033B1C882
MAFPSRALAWVRAVLPEPSRHPSPEVWGARLMAVRSHRRGRQAPPLWEDTGVLVRPYVARLGAGVYAGTWGDA